jgi:hypothetical protein
VTLKKREGALAKFTYPPQIVAKETHGDFFSIGHCARISLRGSFG